MLVLLLLYVDENLLSQVTAIMELIDSSITSAQQRQECLQSALTAAEKMECDLRENIELLKRLRAQLALCSVLSTDVSLLMKSRDELQVITPALHR